MSKKTLSFEELQSQILSLPYDKFRTLMSSYAKTTGTDVKEIEERLIIDDFQKRLETLHINDTCPFCSSHIVNKNGKRSNGLQRYKCCECGRRFTRLSNTILEKTRWHYEIWVEVVRMILNDFSLDAMMNVLVNDFACEGLDKRTLMLWREKILHAMASVPMPKLTGVIQVDETFIRESQKGSKHLIDLVNKGESRKPRYGRIASKYGVMGTEFANITTAIDNRGYCVCKVVCLGRITTEMFFDAFDEYFDSPAYICSDSNPIYQKYCDLRHIPHYQRPSDYMDIIKNAGYILESEAGYDAKKNSVILRKLYSEGLIDEIIIDGVRVRDYSDFEEMKRDNNLSLGRVNQLHSDIKNSIYSMKTNVSTKNLSDYIGAFTYQRNWRVAHGHYPTSRKDAECILIEMLSTRANVTVTESQNKKLSLPTPSGQYMRVLREETERARKASKNKYFKFNPEDGFVTFQTRKYLNNQPTVRLKKYAKACKIKRYTAMSDYQLIHELLQQPNIDDIIYGMLNDDRKFKIEEEDLAEMRAGAYKISHT